MYSGVHNIRLIPHDTEKQQKNTADPLFSFSVFVTKICKKLKQAEVICCI